MSNVQVSSDVLSSLLLLQHCNVYKLQQKVLHDISRSSCLEVFWSKAAPALRLQYRCFPVNFAKFFGARILKNIYERLLLHLKYYTPANNTAKVVAKYSKTVKKLCYESPRRTSRMFFSLYTGVAPAICSYYKL